MAKKSRVIKVKKWEVAASQTIVKGDIVVLSSGLVEGGAAAASAGTVLGVALESITTGVSVDSDDAILVDIAKADKEFEFDYEGSSKTSLANSDRGTSFDLASGSQNTVDLDDTTDGFIKCTGFDNDEDKIVGILENRFYD